MTDILGKRYDLAGKVAAITGGADGIGRASALLLAGLGAQVAILDRDGDKAAALAKTLEAAGATAIALPVDVGNEARLEAAFAELGQRFGRLDVLVNNAGMAVRASADSISLDDWNRVVAVNLTGMFLAARLAARLMAPSGGAIVNTASIAGTQAGAGPIAYSVAKAGVIHLTKVAAAELARDRIRVNAICPGLILTEIFTPPDMVPPAMAQMIKAGMRQTAPDAQPLERAGEPLDIANAALFFSSDESAFVTGVSMLVDGGMHVGPRQAWDPQMRAERQQQMEARRAAFEASQAGDAQVG